METLAISTPGHRFAVAGVGMFDDDWAESIRVLGKRVPRHDALHGLGDTLAVDGDATK